MSAERKALLEISEDDVLFVEVVAAFAVPELADDEMTAAGMLAKQRLASDLAKRMRAALDAGKETKMIITRAIVSVPRIGTVIADAEARTLTPRNKRASRRLWSWKRSLTAVMARRQWAVERAADAVFGRAIAWTWKPYGEPEEAA